MPPDAFDFDAAEAAYFRQLDQRKAGCSSLDLQADAVAARALDRMERRVAARRDDDFLARMQARRAARRLDAPTSPPNPTRAA